MSRKAVMRLFEEGKLEDLIEETPSQPTSEREYSFKERKKRWHIAEVRYLRLFAWLVLKQKGICWLCNKPGIEQIHHIDGNPGNNERENLMGVHAKCNKKEHHERRSSIREKEKENSPETESMSYEARRSIELAPTLELELDRLLLEGPVTVREAQNRLAKICGCDQQTVGRWLDRECVPEGKYQTSDRTVNDGRRKRTLQFLSIRNHGNIE